jgi:hypothetical protein
VRARVRARVRACARACVRACAGVRVHAHDAQQCTNRDRKAFSRNVVFSWNVFCPSLGMCSVTLPHTRSLAVYFSHTHRQRQACRRCSSYCWCGKMREMSVRIPWLPLVALLSCLVYMIISALRTKLGNHPEASVVDWLYPFSNPYCYFTNFTRMHLRTWTCNSQIIFSQLLNKLVNFSVALVQHQRTWTCKLTK